MLCADSNVRATLTTGTFNLNCQRPNRIEYPIKPKPGLLGAPLFPPERCVFSPEENLRCRAALDRTAEAVPTKNPSVLETVQGYRVPGSAVNPMRPQDFHLFSTIRGVSIQDGWHIVQLIAGELFTARHKTLFRGQRIQENAHARSGRSLNIKDRLEVLLFAKTLQGTLSPNANPGIPPRRAKTTRAGDPGTGGQIEGYCIGCRKPPRGFSRQLRHTTTLLNLIVYTKLPSTMQVENQESHLTCQHESRGQTKSATWSAEFRVRSFCRDPRRPSLPAKRWRYDLGLQS